MVIKPKIGAVRPGVWVALAVLVLGILPGCSDRVITISQHSRINTAMHRHRAREMQTGDPLELAIVCVYPEDLKKSENDRLKPGSGLTSVDWYQHRPTGVGGQQAGRFWIPSSQIYLLTNEKDLVGRVKGPALGGATEDGWTEKKFGGIAFSKKLHHKDSVIYVFPKFIGPTGDVLPVKPVMFHRPGAYRRNLFIEIGVRDGGENLGQFIIHSTKRRLHGAEKDE